MRPGPGVGVGAGTEARTKCDTGLVGSCGVSGRRPEEKTGHLLSSVCVVSGGGVTKDSGLEKVS